MKHLVLVLGFILFVQPKFSFALDVACEPFVNATKLKIEQPAWYDITESIYSKVELIKNDGKSFMRKNNGEWIYIPGDPDSHLKERLQEIENGKTKLTNCKSEGSAIVSGIETNVTSYDIEMPELPYAVNAKIYTGKADGLFYLLSTNPGGAEVHYYYKNVPQPKL